MVRDLGFTQSSRHKYRGDYLEQESHLDTYVVLWRERVFYNEWRRWDKRIRVEVRKQHHYFGNLIKLHHLSSTQSLHECVMLLNDSFARNAFITTKQITHS